MIREWSLHVSIPQAVSTVATNIWSISPKPEQVDVSIPQAVSTVATINKRREEVKKASFNTASGKYCCNSYSY